MGRPTLATGLVLVLAAVAGCGHSGATAPPAGTAAVAIHDFKFQPSQVAAGRGARVTFTNGDSVEHTATATTGGFDTGALAPGHSVTIVVSRPGRYAYVCGFHPFMHGTLVVR